MSPCAADGTHTCASCTCTDRTCAAQTLCCCKRTPAGRATKACSIGAKALDPEVKSSGQRVKAGRRAERTPAARACTGFVQRCGRHPGPWIEQHPTACCKGGNQSRAHPSRARRYDFFSGVQRWGWDPTSACQKHRVLDSGLGQPVVGTHPSRARMYRFQACRVGDRWAASRPSLAVRCLAHMAR